MTTAKPYPLNVGALQTYAEAHGTYPLKVLLANGYAYNDAHQYADDVTGELSGGSYARVTLSGVAWTVVDDEAAVTADDPTFAAFTGTFDTVVFFADMGADSVSPLISHVAVASTSSTAETQTIDLPAGKIVTYNSLAPVLSVGGVEPDAGGNVPASSLATALEPFLDITAGGGDPSPVVVSNDWRNWDDGAVSASPFTRGEGSLGPVAIIDSYTIVPGVLQEAQVVDGNLRVRDAGNRRVSVVYPSGADLSESSEWWSRQSRVRVGFMFAGWEGGTDASALGAGTETVRGDAPPAKATLVAADGNGEGYIGQFAARHWDDGGGAEVHYEFNIGRDVEGEPVVDEYHELPRAPIAGDVFEMEIVRADDGEHTITLYFNAEEVDSLTSSAFDLRDFVVFGSPMDNDDIYDNSQWRPGVVATWLTTGEHWRPERPAAGAAASVATDAIFDAKGDLAVGTGANAAAKLTVGANDTILMADSAQTSGVKWATPTVTRSALSVAPRRVIVPDSVYASGTGRGTCVTNAIGRNTQAIGLGDAWGGMVDVSGAATNVVFNITATALTAGQAIIIYVYALGTDGLPTGTPVDSKSVTVGTATGVQDAAWSRTWTPGEFVCVLNPSTNSGSVTLTTVIPSGNFTCQPSSTNNNAIACVSQGTAMGDVSAYTVASPATATAWGTVQFVPMICAR